MLDWGISLSQIHAFLPRMRVHIIVITNNEAWILQENFITVIH